jgi:hypothetical protein
MKQVITKIVETFYSGHFNGTLASAAEEIQTLIKEYGPDAKLYHNPNHFNPYESEASPQYEVSVSRKETDEEYSIRIAEEKALNDKRDHREKAEFERLAKKFGKQIRNF